MTTAPLTFPETFTFGVATSAYQVEGNLENDWSAWERAGRCRDPKARCGKGCGHWERFFDDVPLIRATGATAYRLSIEWARVEPEPGRFDEGAWQGYRDRLEALVKAGIRPVVTLHHFTHPSWFHEKTPWHEPSSLVSWKRYATRCAELLDGLNAAVCTLNEPNIFVLGGFLGGLMPPGLTDGRKAFAAAANLLRAHVIARQALLDRAKGAPIQVGIAAHQTIFAPQRKWHPLDQALTRIAETYFNGAFLEALTVGELRLQAPGFTAGRAVIDGAAKSMEFIGVNYYTRSHLRFITRAPWLEFAFRDETKRGLTDLGWEDYPQGLGIVLRQMKRYGLPVWVTENGIDDRAGTRRPRFLHDHLQQLLLARADGVDVTTYLHWSLMDNFEWLEAWGPRFGLYRVDFETQERTATPAVDYYRRLATGRVLVPPP